MLPNLEEIPSEGTLFLKVESEATIIDRKNNEDDITISDNKLISSDAS